MSTGHGCSPCAHPRPPLRPPAHLQPAESRRTPCRPARCGRSLKCRGRDRGISRRHCDGPSPRGDRGQGVRFSTWPRHPVDACGVRGRSTKQLEGRGVSVSVDVHHQVLLRQRLAAGAAHRSGPATVAAVVRCGVAVARSDARPLPAGVWKAAFTRRCVRALLGELKVRHPSRAPASCPRIWSAAGYRGLRSRVVLDSTNFDARVNSPWPPLAVRRRRQDPVGGRWAMPWRVCRSSASPPLTGVIASALRG